MRRVWQAVTDALTGRGSYLPRIERLDLRPFGILPTVYAIHAPMQFGGFRIIEMWGDWNWEG